MSLDANTADYDRLVKVATKLYRVVNDLKPILKKRELEAKANDDAGEGEAELEYMKSAGLNIAATLEAELEAKKLARAAEVRDPEYGKVEPSPVAPIEVVRVPDTEEEETEDDSSIEDEVSEAADVEVDD